ncbi:MAG: terminase gpA endonuclease subunit, partial [Fluviibacter sp.]
MKDASRIEEQFELGDQRRFMIPCPHCDELQHLKWPNLRWKKDGRRCSAAWYVCEHCGGEISEYQKAGIMSGGRWVPHNPEGLWRSYHINALYSPIGLGLSWAELADEWIEAQDDPSKLMRFVNTRLGETWADRSHDLKPNTLIARAEPYELRTVPMGCLVLTAGIDTQDDRLEIQIVGFGMGDKEWVIDYHVIPGNPAEQQVWDALADYLNAEFINTFGRALRIEASAIDTGGHHTHAVYAFVRSQRVRRCMAIKGASQSGRTILGKPSHQDVNWRGQTIKKGVALYTVGTDTAKHLIYARLNGDADKDPDERKMHFSTELEPKYFDGLVSETYNPRKNRWELKKGKRNEPLDTRVYAIAASHHPELYLHKWRQSDWVKRTAMIEPEAKPEAAPAPDASEDKPIVKTNSTMPAKRRSGGFASNW